MIGSFSATAAVLVSNGTIKMAFCPGSHKEMSFPNVEKLLSVVISATYYNVEG